MPRLGCLYKYRGQSCWCILVSLYEVTQSGFLPKRTEPALCSTLLYCTVSKCTVCTVPLHHTSKCTGGATNQVSYCLRDVGPTYHNKYKQWRTAQHSTADTAQQSRVGDTSTHLYVVPRSMPMQGPSISSLLLVSPPLNPAHTPWARVCPESFCFCVHHCIQRSTKNHQQAGLCQRVKHDRYLLKETAGASCGVGVTRSVAVGASRLNHVSSSTDTHRVPPEPCISVKRSSLGLACTGGVPSSRSGGEQ